MIFSTNITIKEEQAIRLECQKYQGKSYDYVGLIGFIFKSDDFNKKNKYFCSELMAMVLEKCISYACPKEPCRIHPVKLYKSLKEKKIIIL